MGRYYRKKVQDHSGTVYVLKIVLEGEIVYKVGVTVHSPVKRAMQVIEGIEKEYGYFPEVRIIRKDKTKNHFKVETAIHRQLDEWSHIPMHTFTGSTELFKGMTEEELIEKYELAINSDEPEVVNERLFVW